jgi:glycolate oxidase
VRFGGTITGEHGVGIEKIMQMCAQFSIAEELAAFRGVKAAFDEHGLLNPGKGVPTPRPLLASTQIDRKRQMMDP